MLSVFFFAQVTWQGEIPRSPCRLPRLSASAEQIGRLSPAGFAQEMMARIAIEFREFGPRQLIVVGTVDQVFQCSLGGSELARSPQTRLGDCFFLFVRRALILRTPVWVHVRLESAHLESQTGVAGR